MKAKKGAGEKPRPVLRETRLVEVLRKKFGASSALIPDETDTASRVTGYVPTGLDVLDHYVIGGGGLPEGKISEVFADEGLGKSSLAYTALAAAQRAGASSTLFDPELTFDDQRAETLGVDLARLVYEQPEHLEQLIEMVKLTLKTHDGKVPMLVVWDSIASTNTKQGLSLEAGKARVGEVPLLLSNELKKILALLHKKRAHLLMVNQTRQKIGVVFGSNITTPGGNAPKFYSWCRLWLMGGKAVKVVRAGGKKEHVGKIVSVAAAKNKTVPPWRRARLLFRYSTGYDNEWSTIQHAVEMGVLAKPPSKRDRAAYELACEKLGWSPAPPRVNVGVEEELEPEGDDDDDA